MSLRDRIGIDLCPGDPIEAGIEAAIAHGVRYLDLKIDTAPNDPASLGPERVRRIREAYEMAGIEVGIHTSSAVNVAESAPYVGEAVDRYLEGHLQTCGLLGGGWMIVHAGFHFTADRSERMEAAVARLQRLCERAERTGITLLLENMNKEPEDAEVHYLGYDLEETRFFFDRLQSPVLRWAFTANHAHLVPEGVEGFLSGMDFARCDEIRLADCRRLGKEEHLRPGEGDMDFAALFRRADEMGFSGHYMTAFGSLQDMLDGRETLARIGASLAVAP